MNELLHLDSPPPSGRVFAAMTDEATLVQVVGVGNFRLAGTFKHTAQAAIRTGSPLIVVDMAACPTLDSTFMGAIAGLGLYCIKIGSVQMILINATQRAFSLLRGLGVSQLVKVYTEETLPPELSDLSALEQSLQPIEEHPPSEQETTALMLDAHETLSHVSPENLQRFKDVVRFLREDMERLSDDNS